MPRRAVIQMAAGAAEAMERKLVRLEGRRNAERRDETVDRVDG
jgi:hypothetical protein